jgi:hypothetical protein
LPGALNLCTWSEDVDFAPGDALLANPELKEVFVKALAEGLCTDELGEILALIIRHTHWGLSASG